MQIDETTLFPPEPVPVRGRRHRGRPSTPTGDRAAIALVALAAAVGAGLADGAPSGWEAADALYRGGFAALVTVAGSRSRRSTWLWASGVATVASSGAWLLAAGLVAMAVAVAAHLLDRRRRLEGAVVLALTVQVLLRLGPVVDWFGGSTLLVVVAVAPTLVSAYRVAPRRLRRRVHQATAALGVLAVLGLSCFLVSTVLAASRVGDGVAAARDGLAAAREGEDGEAADRLTEAAADFEAAQGVLDSWWARPGRAVPFVGQQARAVVVATEEGHRLASVAAAAAATVPVEDLVFEDGRIDLALVEAAQGPLADTAAAIVEAQVRLAEVDTGWVMPPIAGRLDRLRSVIDDAATDARLATELAEVAPGLLGGDGTRRYFVIFTTPAESRGLGGFMGNWGELTATEGKLTFAESGRANDLNEIAHSTQPVVTAEVDGEVDQAVADYLDRYYRLEGWTAIQDVTASPDLPTVAEVVRQLYPQVGGEELDGVLLVDPFALAALMRYSGPIELPGVAEPLDEHNAADFLLRTQYELTDREEREDLLADASDAVFDRLTNGNLPNPRVVADHLAPLSDEGRIGIVSFHPEEADLFARLGIDDHLPAPGGGDAFSLVTSNGGQNKIDVYLERSVRYEVTFDPSDGRVEATATVELTNAVPSLDLPAAVVGSNDQALPTGTNEALVSVYTPHRLVAGRVDGERVGFRSNRELGYWVFGTAVQIPPGETVVVEVDLEGALPPGADYALDLFSQPLVNEDEVVISLDLPAGWEVGETDGLAPADDGSGASGTPEVRSDRRVWAEARRR